MILADDTQINSGAIGGAFGAIGIAAAWLISTYFRIVKDRREAAAEENKQLMEREKFRADSEASVRAEWRELTTALRKEINELRDRLTKAEMESRECERRFEELREELEELKGRK